MFCIHSYALDNAIPLDKFYDFEGNRVRIFKCKCVKCGKQKKIKIYG